MPSLSRTASCETAIIVPRVGPSMTDEDIKQEWELDYLTRLETDDGSKT